LEFDYQLTKQDYELTKQQTIGTAEEAEEYDRWHEDVESNKTDEDENEDGDSSIVLMIVAEAQYKTEDITRYER
jgi:hypothetical protein